VTVVPNAELNVSPAWLPDGRLLFVSGRGGGRDVYVVELNDDGTPKRLPERVTTGLNPHTISVSQDGRSMVYSTLLRRQNVWAVQIPTGEPVSGYDGDPITTGRQVVEGLAVSPDGQSLAFDSNRSGNQEVYIQPLAGGQPVQVTDHPAEEFVNAWSPDGQWLTGHGFRNGNRDVYVVRADGTGYQIVDDPLTHERYPDWSPDGENLAFQSNVEGGTTIFITSRADGLAWSGPVTLTRGTQARWSPTGGLIAFADAGTLGVINRDGGQQRQLFEGDVAAVFWSSDGREVIFLDRFPDGTAAFRAAPLDGAPARTLVLFDDPLRSPRPEFFVHGDRLYYTYAELEGDIWVMDLNW
jgi:TolB protein